MKKFIGDDGYSTIRGYIARYDVSHISGYDNVVESSRLDYITSSGSRPYPEWRVNENLEPIEGAELHKVIDSEDYIVAIFDGEHFREVVKNDKKWKIRLL